MVGGFLVSLLGGSRFQIGGPAGAFIVLVALTVERHGVDGVILATMMAGVFLIAAGLLRLGTYIKFIPYPVTVGFTAGIAVIIFASQLRDLLGLTLAAKEPGELIPKLQALARALHTVQCRGRRGRARQHRDHRRAPEAAAALARHPDRGRRSPRSRPAALSLPVETIGTRFGGIPARICRGRHCRRSRWRRSQAVLPDAIAFALLGAIESLLSAVVADGMTGRRHRSNCELVAQGVANIGSALFGGICVTGTIARTATNVRAGARGPVSGMLHSLFLLLFMLIAAPLASYIPLAALAAVLVVVAWNMAEKHEFATLLRSSLGRRHRAARDLPADDLSRSHRRHSGRLRAWRGAVHPPHGADDRRSRPTAPLASRRPADDANGDREPYDPSLATDPDVLVYRITGAFFFGAASTVGTVLDSIADRPQGLCGRFLGGAVPGFHRGERDGPGRGQGEAAGHPALHHRRVAGGAPRAADPWGEPAAGAIPRNGGARGRRHQGT